jgi:purine-cytosine permease-like protein
MVAVVAVTAVLTVLAGVHVVELLGLWLVVFLVCVWLPAALRSFSTDALALLSVALASTLLLWMEELDPAVTVAVAAASAAAQALGPEAAQAGRADQSRRPAHQ